MSFMEFFKKNLMNYFIIVTCITVAIAVLGSIFDSGTLFSYEAYYSPIIIGAVAVLPSFVMYSRKELTFQQMLVRRILHFVVLQATLLGFGYFTGLLDGLEVSLSFVLSVCIIYLITCVVGWFIDSNTAKEINKGLKRLQS